MTSASVTKKSVLKQGLPMSVNADGVVVISPGPSAVYQIDSLLANDTSIQFSGAVQGVTDVSYPTLLALAEAAFPSLFP
jgi:hypothetical protein